MPELFAEVALFNALAKTLHYEVPSELRAQVQTGVRVMVPLGGRRALGLVVGLQADPPEVAGEIVFRRVLAVVDQAPVIPGDLLTLCLWVSQYYFYPLGEVLQLALPANARKELGPTSRATSSSPDRTRQIRLIAPPAGELKRNRSLMELLGLLQQHGGTVPLPVVRKNLRNSAYWIKKLVKLGHLAIDVSGEATAPGDVPAFSPVPAPEPTSDQRKVLAAVQHHLEKPSFETHVIFGVTGSGKSEVYLRLVETALRHQKGALLLVPEIALTFQLESLFRQRFGSRLAIWHSGLSGRARQEEWQGLVSGEKRVLLGARSAVFMPVSDLGLIIVDEEHDSSYKQDDHLRYQARDVALMRAQMLNIPAVLGSATPSLQSIHHSRAKRYSLLSLPRRIHGRPLPSLEIIDMRKEKSRGRILSRALKEALVETLGVRQQALLFLNRRGFATFVLCNVCGHVLQCESCSVSLTYHEEKQTLRCHYCGMEKRLPERCPVCEHRALVLHGFGTERVEKEVAKLFPEARVLRIDRDTVTGPRYIQQCLEAMRKRKANVLIGTQMLAKGHDFPNLTLVGIVNADTSLQIADFRAGETTVQLLMQVAGRAGRGDQPGRVLLQTYNPSHYTMEAVTNMDYLGFCEKELESREKLQYPPFARLLRFLITSTQEEMTRQAAYELAGLCRGISTEFRSQEQYLAILGPSPAPLAKLKNRFRWHVFVKAWTNQALQRFTEAVLDRSKGSPLLRRVQLAVDRDPTMMM